MILEGNIVIIILDAWSQIQWPLLIEHGEKYDVDNSTGLESLPSSFMFKIVLFGIHDKAASDLRSA